jgi:hypothetical protein
MMSLLEEKTTSEKFWRNFINEFGNKVKLYTRDPFPIEKFPPESDSFFKLFDTSLMGVLYEGKECILLLDEIDSLSKIGQETREIFLSKLRVLKQEKVGNLNANLLYSVLGITNWIGDYIEDTIQGSPFNISNKITAPYFTREEVYDLFGQYEKQEAITLEKGILDHIFEQTAGAQGLTVLFGKCFESRRQAYQHVPTLTEWKNFTYGSNLFSYASNESTNLSKMLRLITESEKAESCKVALLSFLSKRLNVFKEFPHQVETLLRANILKKSEGVLEIASPFVRKMLLYFLSKEKNRTLRGSTIHAGF